MSYNHRIGGKMERFQCCFALTLSCAVALPLLASPPFSTDLTHREEQNLLKTISGFYNENSFDGKHRSRILDQRIPKFSASTGRARTVNPELTQHRSLSKDPLVRLAGGKATTGYKNFRCKTFWKNFKGQECGPQDTRAAIQSNDEVADLAHTWIPESEIAREMKSLPQEGKVNSQPWSGDYWRTRWGLTSYRYLDGKKFETYELAVAAYRQPFDWLAQLPTLHTPETTAKINRWSPAEKYDLLTGSETFTLTNQQKAEGADLIGEDGKVEDWYGLCHGWAPAALLTPPATSSVSSVGSRGIEQTWSPHEIRGMVALAWSNGEYSTTFAGSRCDVETPRRHPNGRLINQDCFDTNPATLHLALANMLGRHGMGFVMDAAFDAEINNQPVVAYSFQFFNPYDPTVMESDWEKAAVAYDDKFKKIDRFQTPMSRGYRADKTYSDEKIKSIVGVAATLVYLDESDARPGIGNNPIENETIRVTYTYDLELEEQNGKLIPTGGEWHTNSHPDFLWMAEQNSYPHQPTDDEDNVKVSLTTAPSPALNEAAEKASFTEAYPLCAVVKALVEASSGTTYHCK